MAFLADEMRGRHAHVVEHDLPRRFAGNRLVAGGELDARRVHVEHETRNAAVRALGAIRRRHQDDEIGAVRVGDEALHAVDDVAVAVAHRRCAHRARVGAGVGLGLREATLALAADRSASDSARACRLRAHNSGARMSGPRMRTRAHRQRDRAPELGPDNRTAKHTEPLPAPFLRQIELPQAERLAALDERRLDVGLELAALERFAFERNKLVSTKRRTMSRSIFSSSGRSKSMVNLLGQAFLTRLARRWLMSGISFSALAPLASARPLAPSPRTAST